MKEQDLKYGQAFSEVVAVSGVAQSMLKKQVFSQQMMENLVNDLLDLAKLENN